jgi:hypothetical protein
MVPPAADVAGSQRVPEGWLSVASGDPNGAEPGPDDITTPMKVIQSQERSAKVAGAAASARAEPPTGNDGRIGTDGRKGADSGQPRVRGPFEPANDLAAPADESLAEPFYRGKLPPAPEAPSGQLTPVPAWPAGEEDANAQAAPDSSKPMSQAARASMWSPSTGKMDRIKDLYFTAEAIGEDALDKHFELVSDRQRQLIREYFDGSADSGAESG